jgi:hypothetical protein
MEKFTKNKGVSIYAYKGDAMTLLAFDLDKKLLDNFIGFTIKVKANGRQFFINNKMQFDKTIKYHKTPKKDEIRSSEFSPIQKFRWIHVPSTVHYIEHPYFGNYTYEVTPRYISTKKLLPLDDTKTVSVTIDVSPFNDGDVMVGFTRSFISSQAFSYHFGNKLNLRPNKLDLTYNIKNKAGTFERYNPLTNVKEQITFSYEDIHRYLGWQARNRIMEILEEVENNKALRLDVFAYDLNEPTIVTKLLNLAKEGRVRIILDNYPAHSDVDCFETKFEKAFHKVAKNKNDLMRGHFSSQAHSKVFIQKENKKNGKAVKVLTGSTNFATNGLYINANHVLIFNRPEIAQTYADVFDASFGERMSTFKKSALAIKEFKFNNSKLTGMSIRFSPHPKAYVDDFFKKIVQTISNASSDVLFAIMKDDSKSDILDAIMNQVQSSNIFTAGITDVREGMQLYKPGSKKGIRISGLSIAKNLPPPFSDIINVPGLGHCIHHKFIVVDFKGDDPIVYCGSSNLAYDPEQKNGDNLIEIRDKEIVTAFAVEAIRLIDHFHWLNKLIKEGDPEKEMNLYNNSEKKKWYEKYYNPKDLKYEERTLLVK